MMKELFLPFITVMLLFSRSDNKVDLKAWEAAIMKAEPAIPYFAVQLP